MKHLTREEAKWLQSSINVLIDKGSLSAPRLRIDGIVGQKTVSSFGALSNLDRVAITRAAEILGIKVDAPVSPVVSDSKTSVERRWVATSELHAPAFMASVAADVPFEFIMRLVHIEATQRVKDGVVEYDANSKRGVHRGLTQMSPDAWIDASEWLVSKGKEPLPSFSEHAFEVGPSLLAAAAYNARYAPTLYKSAYVREPTFAMRYTLHNQGPNWLTRARQRQGAINFAGQSSKARQLISEAAMDMGVVYA